MGRDRMILTPRVFTRSAFLCAIAVTAASLFRFGSTIVPFSLLPAVYVFGAISFSPQENFLGWTVYCLLGLIGLPVFASSPFGGLGYILKPTFGFILGYIVLSPLISRVADRQKPLTSRFLLFLSLAAIFMLYLPGLLYFWFIMKFVLQTEMHIGMVLKTAFWPFIGGDILKAIGAFFIALKARSIKRK